MVWGHKTNTVSMIFGFKKDVLHPLKMWAYDFQIKYFGAWRFFMKQMKSQEKAMMKSHYIINCEQRILTPCIVHTCNGFTWSGGLADRLKGIVSAYEWCKRHDRPFKINFCEPFNLQDYLVPNEYDWLPNDVSYEGRNVHPIICLMEPRTGKYLADKWNDIFDKWMGKETQDMSMQYHIYTNVYCSDCNFSHLFNTLFKPCDRLQKELAHHFDLIGEKYISISFRFTTLLGDFTDCTGSPLDTDRKEKLILDSLNAIVEISHKAPKHDMILVTADSQTFLNRIKYPDVYVVPGELGHIDYDHSDDVNMKTFLDFFMISKAEAVYLAKGPGMYNSAFAKTAAMVNDKPFEIFEY